jgi:3-methylcrotonyl-CoA carboxylase alpha subunit
MIRSLLIANRGEIACRVIATARRLGIRTVAVYSDADANARHVRLADEAVRIGPAAAKESYLVVDAIIEAARRTGAEAIHPGYGFLSENAALPEACAAAGIIFVGPTADSIRAMGSKSAAKALMERAHVPLTQGYHGDDQRPEALAAHAARIGYPVLIKASAGGGGKGMRRVDAAADFEAALLSCRREALGAFGSDQVLIETYVVRPRHIEVQVFGDTHGNYVYLFERDCSVQRRHQKVLEEAPAPGMTEERRAEMGKAAVMAARAVNYVGAGTVEFIVDPQGRFYFMEMNTRLQVEHPVTEKITGLDLVEWQLRVASGEKLPLAQEQLRISGHAIEARLYAENPDAGFLPQTGRLVHLALPGPSANVRVDTGIEQGDEVTPFYDPMIAKLIVWGEDREQALGHMSAALARCEVVGLVSNVDFLGRLVKTRSFASADLDTSLIEREHEALFPAHPEVPEDVWRIGAAAQISRALDAEKGALSPFAILDGFRLSSASPHLVTLRHGETVREMRAERVGPDTYVMQAGAEGAKARVRFARQGTAIRVEVDGRSTHATAVLNGAHWHVFTGGRRFDLLLVDPLNVELSGEEGATGVRAPMPGKVIAHIAEPGKPFEKGAPLIVLESMKMELTLTAPRAGVIESFRFAPGEQVSEGAELVNWKAD